MQDAALAQLHSQLESAQADRGAHGGLGFSKPDKGARKRDDGKETLASRTLLGGGGGGGKKGAAREFHTTSAGAVAAGHWDPFARPVEFKMKEVNRRVGGLYTMFVKGGTMGSKQDDAAESAPAPAATAASSASATPNFDWKKAVRKHLRDSEGHSLRLKRLRKAVLAEYAQSAAGGGMDKAEAKRKLRKKLKRMDGVALEGKMVRLSGA